MAPLSEEEDNYIRSTLLLKGVSPRAVRFYFDRVFPPTDLRAALIQNRHTLQGLRSKRVLNQPQWNLLCLEKPNGVPDSTSFDVHLMICLIRHLTPTTAPIHGYDRLPLLWEITPSADLARIKFYYNMILFHGSDKITTSDFQNIWRDVSDAIRRLAGPGMLKECEELRTKLLYQQISTKGDNEKDTNIRNKIPDQITNMDETSIKIYLKALKTGSERRRDINLVIVGKKGVGKTSLVRRLFGENIDDVKSTNGIEIHRRRCRISLNNWEWNKIPDTTAMKERSIINRILQSMVKQIHNMSENSSLDVLESEDNEKNKDNTATGEDLHFSSHEEFSLSDDTTTSHSSELALQMLSNIVQPDLDLQDEDSHATLTVWDFAGDKEFYNTHQTFLTPEAIYIVVANMDDIDSTEACGLLHKFNTIYVSMGHI